MACSRQAQKSSKASELRCVIAHWPILIAFLPLCMHLFQVTGWAAHFPKAWQVPARSRTNGAVDSTHPAKISVVLPVRNEALTLPNLLHDLARGQRLPSEVIIVDDDSDDGTKGAVASMKGLPFVVRLMDNPGRGKKPGLSAGIQAAKETWAVQVDADVRLGPDFIGAIERHLERHGPSKDMLLLPLRLANSADGAPQTRFERLQSLDFAAMQGWAVAAVQRGRPAMASGGAWAWRADAFPHHGLKPEIASGDDVFALAALIARGDAHRIGWCGDATAMASAATMPNLRSLLHQRVRWGAKSTAYPRTLAEARRVAIVIAAVHLAGGVLLCTAPLAGIAFWLAKAGIDMTYTHLVAKAYGLFDGLTARQRAQDLVLLAILHPLFIITTLFLMPFRKARWKGRATG